MALEDVNLAKKPMYYNLFFKRASAFLDYLFNSKVSIFLYQQFISKKPKIS